MKNDLISRSNMIDALEKELRKCREVNVMSVWSRAIRTVENQPCAYDVETVDRRISEYFSKVIALVCDGTYNKVVADAIVSILISVKEIVRFHIGNGGKEIKND